MSWVLCVIEETLLDSDIIIKACAYSLVIWEKGGLLEDHKLGTLAASLYIIPKRLQKPGKLRDRDAAASIFKSLLSSIRLIEPSTEELTFSAELELIAQRSGLAFDVGESQLLAILVKQKARLLLTGDKRAIAALGILTVSQPLLESAAGKVVCVEQLFLELIRLMGGAKLRSLICKEPGMDTALSICFGCVSGEKDESEYLTGLTSYISDIKRTASQMLAANDSLSATSPQENSVGRQ